MCGYVKLTHFLLDWQGTCEFKSFVPRTRKPERLPTPALRVTPAPAPLHPSAPHQTGRRSQPPLTWWPSQTCSGGTNEGLSDCLMSCLLETLSSSILEAGLQRAECPEGKFIKAIPPHVQARGGSLVCLDTPRHQKNTCASVLSNCVLPVSEQHNDAAAIGR